MSFDESALAARERTAQIRGPGLDRHARAARHRGARAAGDALDQHRHALQHHLPELLHRIEPEQRPARLHHAGRGRGLLRRDRGRRARHARDRLHRRRAVHEPAPRSPWWGMRSQRGFAVLLLTNAMQPMQRPKVKRGLLELNAPLRPAPDAPRQPRPLRPRPARGRAGPAHLGAHHRRARLAGARTASGSRSPGAPAGTRTRRIRARATPA